LTTAILNVVNKKTFKEKDIRYAERGIFDLIENLKRGEIKQGRSEYSEDAIFCFLPINSLWFCFFEGKVGRGHNKGNCFNNLKKQ
jgi:hypothetical protein